MIHIFYFGVGLEMADVFSLCTYFPNGVYMDISGRKMNKKNQPIGN
jgi:hypothetical protein